MTFQPKPLEKTISVQVSAALKAKVEDRAASEGVAQQEVIRRALFHYFDDVNTLSGIWETLDADEHYDPDRFYTQGRDQQGHHSEARIQIPPQLMGEIARMIEDRRIPYYQSRQHFFRDAAYHRAKQVARMLEDGRLEDAVNMAMLESDEIQEHARVEDARRLIDAMEANLKALLGRAEVTGNWNRLERYLTERANKGHVVDEEFRGDYEGVLREYWKLVKKQRRRASTKE